MFSSKPNRIHASANSPIIVLCAGRCERWRSHLGIIKSNIEFNGESLLNRSFRLFKKSPSNTFNAVYRDSKCITQTGDSLIVVNSSSLAETILCTKESWGQDRTVFLLGDVFLPIRLRRK
jgi:choline kinase